MEIIKEGTHLQCTYSSKFFKKGEIYRVYLDKDNLNFYVYSESGKEWKLPNNIEDYLGEDGIFKIVDFPKDQVKQKLYAKMKDGKVLRVINYDYQNEKFTFLTKGEKESKKTKSFKDVKQFLFKNEEGMKFKKGDILKSLSILSYNLRFVIDDADFDKGYRMSIIQTNGALEKITAYDSIKYVENNFEKVGER